MALAPSHEEPAVEAKLVVVYRRPVLVDAQSRLQRQLQEMLSTSSIYWHEPLETKPKGSNNDKRPNNDKRSNNDKLILAER